MKLPHKDYPQLPENEHLSMRIAEAFGIPIVPSSPIRLSSGELAYITRRIDRTSESEKIHMVDMFQVMDAFDKYKGSMEKASEAITQYVQNTLLELSNFFELTFFVFLQAIMICT